MNEAAEGAAWTSYMIMGMYVLYKDFGYGGVRLSRFVESMHKLFEECEDDPYLVFRLNEELKEKQHVYIEMPD